MLRIALRQHRVGLLGFAGFLALNIATNTGGFVSLNDTAAKRVAFGAQMHLLAPSFSIFVPYPVRPDTLWGYNEWRGWALGALALAIWAVVAGSGVVRGEEERGLLETWLVTGLRRRWLVVYRTLAFAIVLLGCLALGAGLPSIGLALIAGADIPWWGMVVQAVAIASIALVFFGLAAAFSSLFATRRNAGGAAAMVMLALFVLAGIARTVDAVKPFRWISPFAYYDRVHALAPGGAVDWWGIAVPAVAAVVLALIAAWLLHWRDVGSVLVPRRRPDAPPGLVPARNPLFRLPIVPGLWDQRVGLALWCAGIFVDGLWLTSVSRPMYDAFKLLGASSGPASANVIRQVLGIGEGGNPYAGIVGTVALPQTLLVVAAFSIYQASRWAAEDNDGRLELLLASGTARWQVIAERMAALTIGAALVALADFLGVWIAATSGGLDVSTSGLALAAALSIPLALAFGAAAAALTAWRPRAAVAMLGAAAFASYFLPFVSPLFRAPEWVRKFSLFDLYGKPLVDGVYWTGLGTTLAIAAACLAVALAAMQRREVGR